MRDGGATLVAERYREVTSLSRASLDPTSDRRMNRLQGALYEATAALAAAPSIAAPDMKSKLTILCARLRENLHPEHRGELLTYLLAESLREDLRLLCEDHAR
jgi:hypothetical protein